MLKNWLLKRPLIKALVRKRISACGRSRGKIVTRHKRQGYYSNVHLIDRYRLIWNLPGIIVSFERNRTMRTYLALVAYPIGIFCYIRACAGQSIGDKVLNAWTVPIKAGNCMPLLNIPLNIKINSIESRPGSGAIYSMVPGSWAKIIAKGEHYAKVTLMSGKIKFLDLNCLAVIGRVSNVRWHIFRLKKAGQTINFGRRPKVRGVAKNPVDHPHGGGKGKKSKNAAPEAPWGRRGKRKKKKRNGKKLF